MSLHVSQIDRKKQTLAANTLTNTAEQFRQSIKTTMDVISDDFTASESDVDVAQLKNSMSSQAKFEPFDLIVIGGGITGAGILREAARRGLRVLLLEQKDFAWGTSSRSSKMVHGGLRYLAGGHIALTRESVKERQRYLEEVPGLVNLMKYLMIHKAKQFPPRWLFQHVLRVYDFFAGKRYRSSVEKSELPSWLGVLTPSDATGGSVFADAITDDSRLVARTLIEAVNDRAVALNYTKVNHLLKDSEGRVCGVNVYDSVLDCSYQLNASVVINATGAWANDLCSKKGPEVRPLRGSHLVIPFWRLPVSCSISVLHPVDQRPMFIYPWQGATVIGTTDLDHKEDLAKEASITQEEVDYLLEGANNYLSTSELTEADIVSSWSGVRPVISSGQGLSPSKENREHTIWQEPGLITVSGGKLTTFRVIAFDVLAKVMKDQLHRTDVVEDLDQPFFTSTSFVAVQLGKLSARVKRRLSGKYGMRAFDIVHKNVTDDDIEKTIGFTEVSWAELEWAIEHESVVHLDDLLLRRTALGHVMPKMLDLDWLRIKALFQSKLGWSEDHWDAEFKRYQDIWCQAYMLPSATTVNLVIPSECVAKEKIHTPKDTVKGVKAH